jgi:hypothetical protein
LLFLLDLIAKLAVTVVWLFYAQNLPNGIYCILLQIAKKLLKSKL